MAKIRGNGNEILSFLNIDYEYQIKEIIGELMEFPDSQFTLTLERKKQ